MLYKTIKKNVVKFYSVEGKANQKRISTLIYIVYGLIKEGSSHLDTLGSVFDKETDIASRSKLTSTNFYAVF
jgi:hypothetical protein